MMSTTWILISIAVAVITCILGMLCGYKLRGAKIVGSLLVIVDPVDGERYMQLELSRKKADEVYDQNEIMLKVIEITAPDKNAK